MTEVQCPYCHAAVTSGSRTCSKCLRSLKDEKFWMVILVYVVMIFSSLAVSIFVDPLDGTLTMVVGCLIFTTLIIQKIS